MIVRQPTPPTTVSAIVALVRYLIGQVPDQETDVWPIDDCPALEPGASGCRTLPAVRSDVDGWCGPQLGAVIEADQAVAQQAPALLVVRDHHPSGSRQWTALFRTSRSVCTHCPSPTMAARERPRRWTRDKLDDYSD
jgi:hypothetical protein